MNILIIIDEEIDRILSRFYSAFFLHLLEAHKNG